MSKQTFTTGQVLTAAQMTSLQQTAMGGGSTTDKVASYVLLAADAGTTVIMNSASATTITVNTALFAAGDTVNIQNIGAGICTITAGTATVNTAGSLALNQYEGGVLYFRSTSASTFFDYVQTGSVSPLTTKGDLYGFSTLDARIPIGTNNQVLTADSAQALGLKWATAASPSYTWTAFTPVVKQGTTTFTVDANSAKSITIDKFVTVFWYTTIATGTGQSNTEIQVFVPTAAPISNFNSGLGLGTINIYDSSNSYAFYAGTVIGGQPTYSFIASGINKATEEWGKTGSDFALQLGVGDVIMGTISYQTA
jgi:hypothetical protein